MQVYTPFWRFIITKYGVKKRGERRLVRLSLGKMIVCDFVKV